MRVRPGTTPHGTGHGGLEGRSPTAVPCLPVCRRWHGEDGAVAGGRTPRKRVRVLGTGTDGLGTCCRRLPTVRQKAVRRTGYSLDDTDIYVCTSDAAPEPAGLSQSSEQNAQCMPRSPGVAGAPKKRNMSEHAFTWGTQRGTARDGAAR